MRLTLILIFVVIIAALIVWLVIAALRLGALWDVETEPDDWDPGITDPTDDRTP